MTVDRGRGPVATVLVQRGTLFTGDIVVAGAEWGRVRALVSDTGSPVESAGLRHRLTGNHGHSVFAP